MPHDGAIIFADLIGKLDAPYKSGPSKAWLKIKNPKAPGGHSLLMGRSSGCQKPAGSLPAGEVGSDFSDLEMVGCDGHHTRS